MIGYVTYHELNQLYDLKKYGLFRNNDKLRKLLDVGEFDGIIQDNVILISIDSFEKYINKIDIIYKDYIAIHDFLKDLAGIDYKSARLYLKHTKQLVNNTCLELIELKVPINVDKKYFINKESYNKFKKDYISISEAYKKTHYKSAPVFLKVLRQRKEEIITFIQKHEFMYIEKEKLKLFDEINNGINVNDAMVQLELKNDLFYKVLEEYNIKSWTGDAYFRFLLREDFETLISKQREIYEELDRDYYTLQDIQDINNRIGNISLNTQLKSRRWKKHKGIPTIVRKGKFKGKQTLYLKSEVDSYYSSFELDKERILLYDRTTSNYYGLYEQVLQIENIHFSQNAKKTKELWFQFVKIKLAKQYGSHVTRTSRITQYKKVTCLLVNTTMEKEIFEFKEKELNLIFFNNSVPKIHQREIYSFLYNINQSFETYGKKYLILKNWTVILMNRVNLKRRKYTQLMNIYHYTTLLATLKNIKDWQLKM